MRKTVALMALAVLAVLPGLTAAQDISKKVELQFYMLGDPPKDLEVVAAEINKLALADLNATVKFNYTGWAGFDQKYNLLLSSGQPVDLLYAANWNNYGRFAAQGAFLPLDGLIQKAAPDLYKFVPQASWKASSVNGKMYGIPSTWKEYTVHGVQYREDLRKKYNLPVPNSVANIEAYADGIKKNEPDLIPIQPGSEPALTAESAMEFKYKGSVNSPMNAQGSLYGYRVDANKPAELIEYLFSKDFADDAAVYKRWADKGFWPKSILSQPVPADGLVKGKYAMMITQNNPSKWAGNQSSMKAEHPDWDLGWVAFGSVNGTIQPAHPTQNMFVVPKASKNPERALMFYQKLVMDKRYNLLSQYGIEGTHYKVTADGYYENLDPANTPFGREGMGGWAWRNPSYSLYEKSSAPLLALFKDYDKVSTPNYLEGFVETPANYSAELAAYKQVWTQYGAPIMVGMAGDPAKAIATLQQKAKEAGIDKIRADVKKQWAAFIAANGLK